MPKTTEPTVNTNDVHALVDQRLSAPQQRAIEDALSRDPLLHDTVSVWRAQRDALGNLHRDVLAEPVPQPLLQAAGRIAMLQRQSGQAMRWTTAMVSVILAFGMGWLSRGVTSGAPSPVMAKGVVQQEFVHQAGLAHAVYLPEKRHPVEVAAAEQEHLVQWLSKRLGKPLKVPDLSSFGYTLVGGRLLPGDIGARAQFMFQNAEGKRITLYLGQVDRQPDGGDLRETRFHYETTGSMPSFYWFDQGFGYALTGQMPKENLMAMSSAVFQQLWPSNQTP
jgi:anti-sigma factor RsiW